MAVPAKINLPFGIVGTFATTANADGVFSLPITLDATGTYKLTAVGRTSGNTVSSTVTVAGSATGTGTTGRAPTPAPMLTLLPPTTWPTPALTPAWCCGPSWVQAHSQPAQSR